MTAYVVADQIENDLISINDEVLIKTISQDETKVEELILKLHERMIYEYDSSSIPIYHKNLIVLNNFFIILLTQIISFINRI